MTDAFVDESFLSYDDKLFVVVVSVASSNRRAIARNVQRLKRIPKLKAKAELKATLSPPRIIRKLLECLARETDIAIFVAMWQGEKKKAGDYEELYRRLAARCILQTVKRSQRVDVYVDKRYTDRKSQGKLEQTIRESIAIVPKNVVRIFQEDSRVVKELTAPDFMAWAISQRYGRANSEFYNLFRSRIVHLDDLSE